MEYIIKYYKTIDSTNLEAYRLIEKDKDIGNTVLVADFQSQGKGAGTNIWESEAGKNLTFSIILNTEIEVLRQFYMNKLLAISICDFVKELSPNNSVSIKWPNDIFIDNKKVAGMLIKNFIYGNVIEKSVWGIGININQQNFSKNIPNPVSISQITQNTYDLNNLLEKLIGYILSKYENIYTLSDEKINCMYHDRLYKFEEYQDFIISGKKYRKKIIGVNEYGMLILEDKNGKNLYDFKEVKWILA